MTTETTLTPNKEIQLLGNMLYATDADDDPRLLSITKRVGEISADQSTPAPVEFENNPCPHCESEEVAKWSQGAWRCPECWQDTTEKP